MNQSALIFYPESYVGFNKMQLIERHLLSSGVIGNRFPASACYTAGPAYRQFIPKKQSIQQYQYGIIRIHIQAIGQWLSDGRGVLLDRTNLVVVEGDAFIGSKLQCAKLCGYLEQITGDAYIADCVSEITCLGIRESDPIYS